MPSCVWVRVPSLAQKKDDVESTPRHLFSVRARASWLSFPSVTDVTSPQGEYTSPTFRRSHALRTAESSLDHFLRELGRTPNEGGGLLPPGRAAHIPLTISALGIFRVAKTTTLISVKQLIHNNLQVALQLRSHWRTSHRQMRRTAKSTSKRIRGDTYHIVAAVSQERQAAISSQLPGLEQYAQSRAVIF